MFVVLLDSCLLAVPMKPMSTWTVEEVRKWLEALQEKTGEFDVAKVAKIGSIFVDVTEAQFSGNLNDQITAGFIFRSKQTGMLTPFHCGFLSLFYH